MNNEQIAEALRPFAEFADQDHIVPRRYVITQGSPLAKRQLTMGDCYEARAALAAIEATPAIRVTGTETRGSDPGNVWVRMSREDYERLINK